MKKTIATLGILLTMAATVFTGAAIPASAHSFSTKPASIESWSIDDNWDDDDGEESWSIENDGDYATVRGVKHFLALRSKPVYSDRYIIGKLYNGDTVIMTDDWSGDYILVYSPDYDCYGWVSGSYLH